MQRPYWAHYKVDLHVQCTCFDCEMEGKFFILIFSRDGKRGLRHKKFGSIFLLWSVMHLPVLANSARSFCYKRWGRFFHFLWRLMCFLTTSLLSHEVQHMTSFFSWQRNLMQGDFKYHTLQDWSIYIYI